MPKTVPQIPGIEPGRLPFSPVVEANGLVFLAGQVGELVEGQPTGAGVGPQHVDRLLAFGVADAVTADVVLGSVDRTRGEPVIRHGRAFVPPTGHVPQSRARYAPWRADETSVTRLARLPTGR